jgi:hypothetical protein
LLPWLLAIFAFPILPKKKKSHSKYLLKSDFQFKCDHWIISKAIRFVELGRVLRMDKFHSDALSLESDFREAEGHA